MRIFKWRKEVEGLKRWFACVLLLGFGVIALATTLFVIWDVVKWSVKWLGLKVICEVAMVGRN
jgi:hypothetical protein